VGDSVLHSSLRTEVKFVLTSTIDGDILIHAPAALLPMKESKVHIACEPLWSLTVSLIAVGIEKAGTMSGLEHLFSGHSACNMFTLLTPLGFYYSAI